MHMYSFKLLALTLILVVLGVSASLTLVQTGPSNQKPSLSSYFILVNRTDVLYGSLSIASINYTSNTVVFNVTLALNNSDQCIVYWINPRVFNVNLAKNEEMKIPYIWFEAIVFRSPNSSHPRKLERTFNVTVPFPGNYTIGLFVNGWRIYWAEDVFINVSQQGSATRYIAIGNLTQLHYTPNPFGVDVEYINTRIANDKLVIEVKTGTGGPCGVLFGKLGEPLEGPKNTLEYYGLDKKPSSIYIDKEKGIIEIHYIHFQEPMICLALILRTYTYKIPLRELGNYSEWSVNIYVDGYSIASKPIKIQINNTSTTPFQSPIENQTTGSSQTPLSETETSGAPPKRTIYLEPALIAVAIAIVIILALALVYKKYSHG